MARTGRSQDCFFRHEGAETKEIYWRIRPQAIRVQQGSKSNVVDTLGGYFRDVMYSPDPQYSGLLMPEVTLEGTTGAAYRAELEQMLWVFQHSGDRKPDNSPADTYFFELFQPEPYQEVVRASTSAIGWLIHILSFAYDDQVSNPNEIKFTFRCKLLRNVYGPVAPAPPADFSTLPDVGSFNEIDEAIQLTGAGLTPFNPDILNSIQGGDFANIDGLLVEPPLDGLTSSPLPPGVPSTPPPPPGGFTN